MFNGVKKPFIARIYRKGFDFSSRLHTAQTASFWKTCTYNHYIGTSFSVGAFLFGFASILMFCSVRWTWLSNFTNLIFFAGSIPFTIAAGLQHIQSANFTLKSGPYNNKFKLIGWYPTNAGWLSTFTQLIGTLAFNVSTFDAIASPSAPLLSVLEIWAPNFEGSVLFLISGYLAFIEVDNRYWSWKPKDLSWRAVFMNLLGCIFFMISAISTQTPDHDKANWIWLYSNTYTFIGAIFFFIGAQLLIKESKRAKPD